MHGRRHFLKTLAATTAAIGFPLPLPAQETRKGPLRIGLISDVHKDIIHDADSRLQAFVDAMNRDRVDAIMQLGDFCIPKPENRGFLAIFDSFQGPRHHVLGNHDMDAGYSREQAVAFLGMKSRFHSFDLGGFHFIVLDANDRPPGWKSGYPAFIAADQADWLREDLASTRLNTFVLSHQSLERPDCIDNQAEIRAILEKARTAEGAPKVAACLNGHWHIDHHRVIQGIPYIHVNSASYFWLGARFRHERLAPELAARFPVVSSTAPYQDPLFTVLEIDAEKRRFSLRAATSRWMGPSPASLGHATAPGEESTVSPRISAFEGRIGST